MRYDIGRYLLLHHESLKECLEDNLIIGEATSEDVLDGLISILTHKLGYRYDEVADVVTYDFVIAVVGHRFFEQRK